MMKNEIRYQWAASAKGRDVQVYGTALNRVCQLHTDLIRKLASRERRSLERGRYAIFLLQQINNFGPYRERVLQPLFFFRPRSNSPSCLLLASWICIAFFL